MKSNELDLSGILPLTHTFSDGVYVREVFMPQGSFIVGHVHKTRHINIVSTGKALVWMNGEIHEITAPFTFESEAGVRKVLLILEDMFWSTVHVTKEKDLDIITDMIIDKSKSKDLDIEFINKQLIEYSEKNNA